MGNKLVVILNNDNWLQAKKSYVFMPEKERKEILEAFQDVDEVILTKHPKNPKDMSISKELLKIHFCQWRRSVSEKYPGSQNLSGN